MKKFMIMLVCLAAATVSSFGIGWLIFNEEAIESLDKEFGYEEIDLEEKEMFVEAPPCDTCVYIEQTQELNQQGNLIYEINFIKDKVIVDTVKSLSGRAWTQNLDRNISGNSSPSPSGEYVIKPETIGYHPETGGVFIPYEPLFNTQRSHLGFHIDPSWGKDNGEDGTRGCHAVANKKDYNSLLNFINSNSVKQLIIN